MPIMASPTASAISRRLFYRSINDLHFMALDVLHPELIDPVTGAVACLRREGERGELVLTYVSRHASRWCASAPAISNC